MALCPMGKQNDADDWPFAGNHGKLPCAAPPWRWGAGLAQSPRPGDPTTRVSSQHDLKMAGLRAGQSSGPDPSAV